MKKTVQCKHCKGSHNTCLCEAKLGQTSGENNTRLAENSVNTQLVGTEFRQLKRSLVGDRRGELEFCSIRAAIDRL